MITEATNSNCFICFKQTLSVGESVCKDGSVIKSLCRYLEISFEESELSNEKEEDLEVDLCTKCGRLVRLIINQIQMLEVAEMRIRYYLEAVKTAMTESDGDDKQGLISSRGSEVRDAIFGICLMKTSSSQPRVRIDKLKIQPVIQEEGEEAVISIKEETGEEKTEGIEHDDFHENFENPEPEEDTDTATLHIIKLPKRKAKKRFICDHCQKGFVSRGILKAHIDAVHLKIKDFKCDLCGREFFHKINHKHHSTICKGNPQTFSATFVTRCF